MRKSFLFLPLLMMLLAGCGSDSGTASTANAEEFTLQLKPTSGPVAYDFSANLTAKTGESATEEKGNVVGNANLTVAEVGDGKLEVVWQMSDLKMEDATPLFQAIGPLLLGELEKEQKSVTTPTGQSLDEGKTPSGFGLNLPQKPVKVGDTWEGKRPGPDGKDVTVSGKVTGKEGNLLRLELTGVSLSNELKASKPMEVLFDPQTGLAEEINMELDISRPELSLTGKATVKVRKAG